MATEPTSGSRAPLRSTPPAPDLLLKSSPDADPASKTALVADPLSRKLLVPVGCIRPTQATSRPGVPSLCLLFLDGRCRQGGQCHQVHADPAVVLQLRAEAKQVPTCCVAHGDIHGARLREEWLDRFVEIQTESPVIVPLRSMAFTVGLESALAQHSSAGAVSVDVSQICRLHATERCRFTEDCRFLHICRSIMRERFSGIVPDLVPQLELRHTSRPLFDAAPEVSVKLPFAPPPPVAAGKRGPRLAAAGASAAAPKSHLGSSVATSDGAVSSLIPSLASLTSPPGLVAPTDSRLPQPPSTAAASKVSSSNSDRAFDASSGGFVQAPTDLRFVVLPVSQAAPPAAGAPHTAFLPLPAMPHLFSPPMAYHLYPPPGASTPVMHVHPQLHQQHHQQQHASTSNLLFSSSATQPLPQASVPSYPSPHPPHFAAFLHSGAFEPAPNNHTSVSSAHHQPPHLPLHQYFPPPAPPLHHPFFQSQHLQPPPQQLPDPFPHEHAQNAPSAGTAR